ncbi:MAG: hypothetical protein M3R09_06435 [Actinomycetota bacterium]|nr:hypothetical protein [Actinomycetota bacterium]
MRHRKPSKPHTNLIRAGVLSAALAAGGFMGSGTAIAHQHLSAPSGDCAAEGSNVPQGFDNPAGQTPGGRNNAAGNERGSEHCTNG